MQYLKYALILYFFTSCNSHSKVQFHSIKQDVMKYTLVKNWLKLPPNVTLGNPTGVGIDSKQNIFIFCRAGRIWPILKKIPDSRIQLPTVFEFDNKTGQILNSWGQGLFVLPHGLTVDDKDNIWVTDVGLHQVFKFDHNGKLLLKIGVAYTPGIDSLHFNKPTGIAVSKDGSFYVSDGYGNSRVVKFSATGKYLFEWGRKGKDHGEFNIPHSIDLDENENVYVADRENSRIQVFTSQGKFVKQIVNNKPGKVYSVKYDKTEHRLVAVDYLTKFIILPEGSDVILFDKDGNVSNRFGRADMPVCRLHDVAVDKYGSIYALDILGNQVLKFSKDFR